MFLTPVMSETGINSLSVLEELTIPGHPYFIANQDHLNIHGHRPGAYIEHEFLCGRDAKNDGSDCPYMCFCMAFIHRPHSLLNSIAHMTKVL